jgi:hypothetical protein
MSQLDFLVCLRFIDHGPAHLKSNTNPSHYRACGLRDELPHSRTQKPSRTMTSLCLLECAVLSQLDQKMTTLHLPVDGSIGSKDESIISPSLAFPDIHLAGVRK